MMIMKYIMKNQPITYLVLMVCSGLVHAEQQLPAHVFSRGVDAATIMLVDKTAEQAQLIEMQNDRPVKVQSYTDLLFGENIGPKTEAGDKRTPEGVYYVTRFLSGDDLDARYGAGAFPLNYPNPIDQIEGRKGGGIWLHGRDDADQKKVVTRGCVAFTNPIIQALQPILQEQTPVVLAAKTRYLDTADYDRERTRLLQVLDDYIEAWETGDFAALENVLHPDFSAEGKNRSAWLERKKWIHQTVPRRAINAQAVQVVREDDEQVVYQYTQSYCADNIYTRGIKQLYFKQEGDQLKLLTERFSPLPTLPVDQDRIRTFLTAWLKNWNDNKIEGYVAHYDQDFRDARGRNLAQYKDYKKKIFRQRSDQRIDIQNVQVTPLRGNKYRLEFVQLYNSKAYRDKGKKTLVVNACTDDMVIEKETWAKL